jgi:hypothetical protein
MKSSYCRSVASVPFDYQRILQSPEAFQGDCRISDSSWIVRAAPDLRVQELLFFLARILTRSEPCKVGLDLRRTGENHGNSILVQMLRFRDAAEFDRCTEERGQNCDAGLMFPRSLPGLVLSQLSSGKVINRSIFRALFLFRRLQQIFTRIFFADVPIAGICPISPT